MLKRSTTRLISVLAFPDAQIIDVAGTLEVFSRTARWLRELGHRADMAYEVEILAAAPGPFQASCGLTLHANRAFSSVRSGIDTLLISGGSGIREQLGNAELLKWLATMRGNVRRLGSVCTGAFLLAEAGLLTGKRITTHWRACDELQKRYPDVQVEADPIFIRDGRLYTSAGVSAGMDLALALVEEDHGPEIALAIARELVLFLKRPGGQSQFSAQLLLQTASRDPLRELQTWMTEHLAEDLSVPALAKRVAMSPRHFARVFASELGTTPAKFTRQLRLETACRLLLQSRMGVKETAAQCGFGTPEVMRRVFLQALSVSPDQYRRRFESAFQKGSAE